MENISIKIRNKVRMSTFTNINHHSLEVLDMSIREEREIKKYKLEKK